MLEALENKTIDVLIYNVGLWEKRGFEGDYSFDHDEPEDIAHLINVNVTSTITYIQALLPHVRKSENGKIIVIGSTAGLDHTNLPQVSFVASKFGLRGIVNALREHVRKDKISVTCINPGSWRRRFRMRMEQKRPSLYMMKRESLSRILWSLRDV